MTNQTRQELTPTFIDSASLYELVALFQAGDPARSYPWSWKTSLAITHSLIELDQLRMAPAPSGAMGATGSYARLSKAVSDTDFVRLSGSLPDTQSPLRATQEWARNNSPYLAETLEKLLADGVNFVPWLERSIRDAWVEHTVRLHGLFNVEFVSEIAAVLGGEPGEIEQLREKSVDRDYVGKLAREMPKTSEFEGLRDAYIVATLIRGYYHQFISQDQNRQLLRHPLRIYTPLAPPAHASGATVTQYQFKVTRAQALFATIILADALRGKDSKRPLRWIDSVSRAHFAIRAKDDSSVTNKLLLLSNEDVGVNAAVDAAKALEISCTAQWVDKLIDVTVGAALGGITAAILSPFALLPTGLIWSAIGSGAGTLVQPSKLIIRREKRLEKLAGMVPGPVDFFS